MIRRLFDRVPRKWRWAGVAILALALLFVLPAPASAAQVASATDTEPGGAGALGWINVKDSFGVYTWQYVLDLDNGGVTNIGKAIWSALTNLVFAVFYKTCAALALWFIDWVMSMEWFNAVSAPATMLGDGMQQLLVTMGVAPVMLGMTAIVSVFWMARGVFGRGIYELGMSALIFAVAVGIFADPVQTIVGTDGAVYQASKLGLEVSSTLQSGAAPDESVTSDQLRQEQTARLADVFVGDPFQVVNFGKVLSPKCEKVYKTMLRELAGKDDAGGLLSSRNIVGDCDKAAGKWADNPSPEMTLTAVVFIPSGISVLLLAGLVAASVLIAGFRSAFLSVKLLWDMLQALGPGGMRTGLWTSLADVGMSLAMLVLTSAFLGGLVTFIEAVFTAGTENGDAAVETFVIVDVVLIVGSIVFWKWQSNVKAASKRLAQVLATSPGKSTAPASQPRPAIAPVARTAARGAMRAAGFAAAVRLGRGGNHDHPQPEPGPNRPAEPGAHSASSAPAAAGDTGLRPTPPALDTPARRRLAAGGMKTGAAALPGPNPQQPSTGPRPAPTSSPGPAPLPRGLSPRREALTSRIGSTATTPTQRPSTDKYVRVVRDGRVLYVPKEQS